MDKTKKYTLSREIEANREIQSTRMGRGWAVAACVVFALIVCSVPAVQILTRGWPEEWTDDALRTSCYMENALTSHYQQLLTEVLHSGNEKALIGAEGGWLFYTPDVEHLVRPIDTASVSCILDMKRQLEERGIRLVLMPTPLKPIHRAHALHRAFPADAVLTNPDYAEWLGRLAAAGVTVVDPTTALTGKDAFLRTDTHWTPQGMKAAAAMLASALQREVELTLNAEYRNMDTLVCNRGDIYTMLRLAAEVDWIPEEEVRVETVLDAAGQFHSRTPQAEVLLLGDSFTNIYSVAGMGWGRAAGLAEQLSLLLQMPIDVISRNDGGSHATRRMLRDALAKGDDRLAGKKVVVWQFAMRELTTGNWEPMDFTLGEASQDGGYLTVGPDETLTAEATVAEVAPVPHPATVTYEDHVIAVRLTDIEGHKGREALVYMQAMQKRRLLPAANLRPGDRITLTLENWGKHEATEGAFNRSELESDITLMAEPIWAVLYNK